ncbi:hypothetical protein BX666DRAFT_2032292 [Dichotomocladium elegans]|nr:hypothetical protein BX666DRAFT_2032292 [Dichotomocladium elegans]
MTIPPDDNHDAISSPMATPSCPHGRQFLNCVRCQQQRYQNMAFHPFIQQGDLASSFQTIPSSTPYSQGGWWIPQPVAGHRQQQQPPDHNGAQLSKSPTSYMGTFSDDYNYFDVVLDDGTRQKRSVSLSTMPLHTDNESTPLLNAKQLSEYRYPPNERTLLLPKPSKTLLGSDDEDTSDDDEDSPDRVFGVRYSVVKSIERWTALSYNQKMVLKCSFAYALGSLFTFIPYLNEVIGGSQVSSHIVATVTVFFNPAKTIGGMVEAAGFGLLFGVTALLLSLLSLLTTDILLVTHHLYVWSCVVTLGVWVAGSTFVLSFYKAHFDKPSIRTASSLAFIILFSVLVRETSASAPFSSKKVEQTFLIVLTGTAISIAVCIFIWPARSAAKLKSDIDSTLQSTRILLKLLTKTFLLDADLPEFTANKQLESAIKTQRTSFTNLRSSLKDAKLEFYSLDMWRHAAGYDRTVASLNRLSQHIGGLRSSCGLQFEAMHEHKEQQQLQKQQQQLHTEDAKPINIKAGGRRQKMENVLKREHSTLFFMDEDSKARSSPGAMERQTSETSVDGTSVQHQLDSVPESEPLESPQPQPQEEGALVEFIKTVRPPMKSLAYTCKQTMMHLQARFTNKVTPSTPSFDLMKQNLTTALEVFEVSQQRALKHLYRRKRKAAAAEAAAAAAAAAATMTASASGNSNNSVCSDGGTHDRQPSWNIDAHQLHSYFVKQFPAEDVFLVYFFVFCMLEFAKELVCLTEEVQKIFEDDCAQMGFVAHCKEFARLMLARARRPNDGLPQSEKRDPDDDDEVFIPNNHNTVNTLQTPSPTTYIRKFFIRLWSFFSWFREHTVRYAIKSSLTATAIASLAFIPSTQAYFREYRMEWTLITIMAVMSPTVGATNLVAVLRVFATIFGCIVAALVCTAFSGNALLLFLCTWAFSIPCFHIILTNKYGRFGQFALLAYNLVVLFSYNRRDQMMFTDIFELAWKRCVAVSLGVVIGLVVTAYIWPFEARKELRRGLSDLLLHLSWLYKQLVSVYSETSSGTDADAYAILIEHMFYDPTAAAEGSFSSPPERTAEDLSALAERNKIRAARFQKIELAIQVSLVTLKELLTHAPNEPRLKGPFPVKMYETMLTSCQNILDKLLLMRIVVLKDVWAMQVRRALMLPASREWMDLGGNILLYFYLLASALQLKTPLPPYLPQAEKARQVLLNKLETVLPTTAVSNTTLDESYMVYYAYVAMMEDIIQELDNLGENMKQLYGTLVPADQWVRYFGLFEDETSSVNFGPAMQQSRPGQQ